jgi:hypothetical protein
VERRDPTPLDFRLSDPEAKQPEDRLLHRVHQALGAGANRSSTESLSTPMSANSHDDR